MKVLEHTQDVLVLRPAGAGLLLSLFGLLFFVVGVVLTFVLGQTVHLACERLEDQVVACDVRRTFLGITVKEKNLGRIQGAQVAQKIDDEGDYLYRIELSGSNGRIPLREAWSSGYDKKERFAEDVNDFVQDATAPTLELELAGAWQMLFSLSFGLVGLVLAAVGLRTSATTWIFDRTAGVAARRVAGLTGPRVTEYDLSAIEDVRVDSSRDSDGGTTYRVVLWVAGERVPMVSVYSSGHRKKAETAALIRDFLGIGVTETPWTTF